MLYRFIEHLREAASRRRIKRIIREGVVKERHVILEIELINKRMAADGDRLRFLMHQMKSIACVTLLADEYGIKQTKEQCLQRARLTSLL